MAYHIEWYQQNRIIFEKFFGTVTLEDVRNLTTQSSKMFAAGTPLIHVIVDLSEVESFPKTLGVIKEAIKSRPSPDRIGWAIIFGTKNPIIRFFASVLAQVSSERLRVRLMDSLEESVAFVYEQDQSLQNPPQATTTSKQEDTQLPLSH